MKPPQFDKAAVRRSLGRAAASYDVAAVLQHEVCKRMNERLDLIKHQPALLLDAGCGTGNALPLLRARYPAATVVHGDAYRLKRVLENVVRQPAALRQRGRRQRRHHAP